MKLINTKLIVLLALITISAFSVITYNIKSNDQAITIKYKHSSFGMNISNTRALIGWSSHVFVAKVTTEGRVEQYSSDLPRMAFSGEVLDVIKGDLPKKISLSQSAHLYNNVIWIEEGEELLQPNKTYLFVTKYDKENDVYNIVEAGYGNIPITDEAQKADVIDKYSKAYKNEIPYDPYKAADYPAYPIDVIIPVITSTPVDIDKLEPTSTIGPMETFPTSAP